MKDIKARLQVSAGIGTITAIILSYATNHSILWALLHMILGWIYVIYWLFTYSNLDQMIHSIMVHG